VVTGIDAEVGQVVQPGTPVVRVARTDEKEVVIGVPEDQVDELRKVSEVKVRLWADPNQSIPGKIREVSPVADPATRTYTVKVSVPAREDVRLGMTAAVQIVRMADAKAGGQLRVPLSALYQDKGASAVWVVENGAVKLTPVQLGGVSGNEVLLAKGVQAGQTVVTAGVNQLKNGQKVRILTADVARRADAEAEAAGAGAGAGARAPPPRGSTPRACAGRGAAGACRAAGQYAARRRTVGGSRCRCRRRRRSRRDRGGRRQGSRRAGRRRRRPKDRGVARQGRRQERHEEGQQEGRQEGHEAGREETGQARQGGKEGA
jgi:hypothetical protein